MHPYVLMLQYVTAYGIVSYPDIIREFELEGNELSQFLTWAVNQKFVTEDKAMEGECGPFIVASIDGMNWVIGQKRAHNIYMIETNEAPANSDWHSAGIDRVAEIA